MSKEITLKLFSFFFFLLFFIAFLIKAISAGSTLLVSSVFVLLLLLVLIGAVFFWEKYEVKPVTLTQGVSIIFASLAGALICYLLINSYGINNVIASSLVGLGGFYPSILLRPKINFDLAPVIYCGSFVGMVSAEILGLPMIGVAGFIAGALYLLFYRVFNGCGGKLGSIAFMSCVLCVPLAWLLKGNF